MSHYNKGTSHHGPRVSSSLMFIFVGSLRGRVFEKAISRYGTSGLMASCLPASDALHRITGCSSY